jgi:hypothetical protein
MRCLFFDAGRYQGTLTGFTEAVRLKRPGLLSQGALLLQDNARPLTARIAVNLLNSWHCEILLHPPYSPDLGQSDFHLFPKVKHIRGLRFQTDEDVQENVKRWLRVQDKSFYQGFDFFICRYDKCLNTYGDCVGKQTAQVPISNPCVTYCNLFIFQIKNREPCFLTSLVLRDKCKEVFNSLHQVKIITQTYLLNS